MRRLPIETPLADTVLRLSCPVARRIAEVRLTKADGARMAPAGKVAAALPVTLRPRRLVRQFLAAAACLVLQFR